MIIFNNFGHTYLSKPVYENPIVWVDASDINTYNLVLDKLGPELITNGDFSDGLNDWNNFDGGLSLNLGGCKITKTTNLSRLFQFGGYIQQNKTYKVIYEILENNGCLSFSFYSSNNYTIIENNVGIHEFTFTRTNSLIDIYFRNETNNSDITIDNISVKEVLAYDVTSLDNKGELGGVMTLNGNVKFANGGFESWSVNDFITRDLEEPFLTDNSFTIATTFSIYDLVFPNGERGWFYSLLSNSQNAVETFVAFENEIISFVSGNRAISKTIPSKTGLSTCLMSYDLNNNLITFLSSDGSSTITIARNKFNNTVNAELTLFKTTRLSTDYITGQNNPLHEFRLYNRAMSLVEMQDLQTELNNKYTT